MHLCPAQRPLAARLSGLDVVLLLAFLCVGVFADDAHANSAWKQMQGYSTCGGVDAKGNLQEPCAMTRATFVRKAVGACPKGSFFDIGTWSCYSCPTGFKRNARSVTSPKACEKPVTARNASARFEGAAKCPAGTFADPRNGGECWKCPSGYGRTAAAVDAWNACGAVGRKAVSAEFVGRMCNNKDAFRDPRNGGECWSCPEDFQRTASAVTRPDACRITLDFEPAKKTAALTCEPGQHFDFVDGGTCWSCPPNSRRTWFGVKTDKACAVKNMRWVVPERSRYSVFGLGRGAEDILAKMIAERTAIDNAVKTAAKVSRQAEGPLLTKAWEVIDNRPWESPYLIALLGVAVTDAALKPATERTASEKDLLQVAASLIQANRQFVAYQAKQANDTWIVASNKANAAALAKMGAAAIYAGSQVPPPDYNEIVANTIQAGTMVAAPIGAFLVTVLLDPAKAVLLPFRGIKAGIDVASTSSSLTTALAANSAGSVAAAAAAPAIIALAAAVIVSIEMDRIMKAEEADGKIRQAIAIANRPVDIGTLLQQKNGPDEFLFHWAAVLGGNTPPSASFKAQLAAYKSGVRSGEIKLSAPTLSGGQTTAGKPAVVLAPVQVQTIASSSSQVTVGKPADAPKAAAIKLAVGKPTVVRIPGGARTKAVVDLTTEVVAPAMVTPAELKTPANVRMLASSQDDRGCPSNARSGAPCRQVIRIELDPGSKCSIAGDYAARFQVRCVASGGNCRPSGETVAFQLPSFNACQPTR